MKTLGNILWIIFGGLAESLAWLLYGIIFCITIIGIPLGKQCFKFAKLSLAPFGKEVVYSDSGVSLVANIFWIIFCGLEMAAANLCMGAVMCITIIGIPFGKQFFKLAKLSLMPFGAKIK